MFKSKTNNPNQNKIFIFADQCGLCGINKFQDIIDIARKYDLETEVRTISLFNGWRREAQTIGKKLNLEVPFIFIFNSQKGISLEEAREDPSKLESLLSPNNNL